MFHNGTFIVPLRVGWIVKDVGQWRENGEIVFDYDSVANSQIYFE